MGKSDVSDILAQILQRYDLILIQEIRDSSETSLDRLVKKCTRLDTDDPYDVVVSERLGRTNSKEQYTFMYRTKRLSVKETYQYDDGADTGKDTFQRGPFAVRFSSPTTVIGDFGIIAIHTDPGDAVKEIGALHKVYNATKAKWNIDDIMIAGDFNADEGYVDQDDWSKIALRNDRRFKWMIDDDTDTTVGNTDRAYNRFVVAGQKLRRAIVPNSTNVFKFDDVLKLTKEQAEDVSDHYPIEMELTGKPNYRILDKVNTAISVIVHQKQPIEKENGIRKIYRAEDGTAESAFFTSHVNYDDSRMLEVVATRERVDDVVKGLQEFQEAFPGVLEDETIEMVKAYLGASFLEKKPFVYGLNVGQTKDDLLFNISVTAKLQDPLLLSVAISLSMS